MTSETPRPAASPSRWLYSALVASLAINLLVLGFMGTAAWQHRGHGWGHRGPGLLGFVSQLDDSRQAEMRQKITAASEALDPLRQKARDSWKTANGSLTVEPFDAAKAKEAFAKARDDELQLKLAISNSLVDTAATLTPEERKLLQAWRDKRRGKYDKRIGNKGGKPGSED